MVAKATPTVSVSSGCLPKLRLLCLDWFKEISVQDLCYSWKIRTGKETATEFALGPPADISSLFDPERECRISKKPGLPVSSDWRRVFGGAYGLVSPPSPLKHSCPCYGFSSSDKWLDTLECTALQCKGDAALVVTLVFRNFQEEEGMRGRKDVRMYEWLFFFFFCLLSLC